MEYVIEPQKQVKVLNRVEVCVLGGSATGVFAAVRAARLGATIAIVEKQNSFGGNATQGLVNEWHSIYDRTYENQIIGGLSAEMLDRLRRRDELLERPRQRNMFCFNSEELKIELDALVSECGTIVPYLKTLYAAPCFRDGKLAGVFVESNEGRGVILADCFIDATGDGYLCRDIGVTGYQFDYPLAATPCAKIFLQNQISYKRLAQMMNTHGAEFGLDKDWGFSMVIPHLDQVQTFAQTHLFHADFNTVLGNAQAEMEGRRQIRAVMDLIKKYMPEVAGIHLVDLCAAVGIRETVHYHCLHRTTEQDLLTGRKFADAVANGTYPVDIHHRDKPGVTVKNLDGTQVFFDNSVRVESLWKKPEEPCADYWQIPYRALLNTVHPNVLMAGRMLDAEQSAYSAIRVMINLNQLGEAAGVAAVLSLGSRCDPHGINTDQLRKKLAEGGSIVL